MRPCFDHQTSAGGQDLLRVGGLVDPNLDNDIVVYPAAPMEVAKWKSGSFGGGFARARTEKGGL